MSFYVYENWVAEKKAVIHRGECKFCNHGKGCHENPLGNKNGKWHGPFDSYQEAKNFAEYLKNRTVKTHFCIKDVR